MITTKEQAPTGQARGIRNVAFIVAVPLLAASAVVAPAAMGGSVASAAPQSSHSSYSAQSTTTRVQHFYGNSTTIFARKWLRGRGVPVKRGRQCTELAVRLYAAKRWGSLNSIYSAGMTRSSRRAGLVYHRNGRGYVPVPGDVLVERGGSYQHVAVVDRVTKRRVYTVEQNARPDGRHVYKIVNKRKNVIGAYGVRHVGGFIHAKKNRFKNA